MSFLDVVAVIFSNTGCGVGLALVAAYALFRRERIVALWVVLSGVVVIFGNALLKQAFRRDRPSFAEPLHEIGGFSFPSGHSAGGRDVLHRRDPRHDRADRPRLEAPHPRHGVRAAGPSRSAGAGSSSAVHYLSDVVAGLSLGMFVTLGLWVLLVSGRTRLPHELAVLTGSVANAPAVIINPSKIANVEEFKSRARYVADREGWNEPIWFETTVEDPGHGQANGRAARRGRPDHRGRW